MKIFKTLSVLLISSSLLLSSCGSFTNLGKGTLIGGGAGGALGAGIGALIGKGSNNTGKGAAIGAAIGTAVGAGAGALIGKKMDDQKKKLEAELAEKAKVEETTDANGLKAIKVTFEGGILFPTGKYTLNNTAKKELVNFATSLKENPDTDVKIIGYTDNTGSMKVNEKLSNERAAAVLNFIANQGVATARLASEGIPMADYVASNETAEGRAQNRRVEIYISANKAMIEKAEAGTL